ncbi:MAG: hypothetical protein NT039_03315 [Candidatus Berkelbacteria bacterium]|nr:hypothetical protein [Candidatus Berkelbacteria bacterium]
MEKVIYLEPDDEITGVIDKIKKVNQDRVILVVPKAATILQSIVNLKILKQQAVRLGKAISIVTSDEIGRNLASQIGLTVYRDLAKRPIPEEEKPTPPQEQTRDLESGAAATTAGELEKKEPPKAQEETKEIPPEPETSKRMIDIRPSGVKFTPYKDGKRAGLGLEKISKSPIRPTKKTSFDGGSLKKLKIVAIILLIVAILEGVLAYFYLPRANVNVVLKAEKLDKTYEITAQKDATLNEETNIIPAQIVSIEKEGNKDLSTTGTKDVGEKAKGTITVINETGADQPLVATTRFVSSNGLVFRSTSSVTVPKAYLDPGGNKVNGSINVSVVADTSGGAYNIGPSNFTIPGLSAAIQSKVYGRSGAAMSGGSSRKIKIVSEADVQKAQTELLNELITLGKEEALSKTNKYEDITLEGSAGGIVVSGLATPAVGAEAETFKYNLKATINVTTVKKSDYYGLLTSKINKEIPNDKELLQGELEKTTESKVVSIDMANGKMVVSSHVVAPIVAKMDLNVMKNNIKGKSVNNAISYLKAFDEVYDAQISLWPFFARKVPITQKRIYINISYHL